MPGRAKGGQLVSCRIFARDPDENSQRMRERVLTEVLLRMFSSFLAVAETEENFMVQGRYEYTTDDCRSAGPWNRNRLPSCEVCNCTVPKDAKIRYVSTLSTYVEGDLTWNCK